MKNQKGFTLIELLVVITIIGILAIGAVQIFSGSQEKAQDAVRKSDITTLNSALTLYNAENSSYPTTGNITTGLQGSYIQQVPTDPVGTGLQEYTYAVDTATNTSFELTASFAHADNADDMTNDDGGQTDHYEVGTNLGLIVGAAGATGAATASGSATITTL